MDCLESNNGQTVLMTGGASAIDSNRTRPLAEAGARVIVLDDLSSAERRNVLSLPGVLFAEEASAHFSPGVSSAVREVTTTSR